jgi:hypothetical protein
MTNTRKKHKHKRQKRGHKSKKNDLAGLGPESTMVVGVNFEGGKITEYIRNFSNCVAYANCQISMDAPFSGRVADESVRSVDRSELSFPDYDESKLISKFRQILSLIKSTYLTNPDTKLVIQVARGRAAFDTICDIIMPLLKHLKIKSFQICSGYREIDYYNPCDGRPFVFVNYGMYGVLKNEDKLGVGEICNPIRTFNITGNKQETGKYIVKLKEKNKSTLSIDKENIMDSAGLQIVQMYQFESDERNVLNRPELEIMPIYLFGIDDDMDFIVPDKYDKSNFDALIELI